MATVNNHPLAKYRRERGITQETLARELGVWPLTVWRWEKGERTPRKKDAQRISTLTGIPVPHLLMGETPPLSPDEGKQ